MDLGGVFVGHLQKMALIRNLLANLRLVFCGSLRGLFDAEFA